MSESITRWMDEWIGGCESYWVNTWMNGWVDGEGVEGQLERRVGGW